MVPAAEFSVINGFDVDFSPAGHPVSSVTLLALTRFFDTCHWTTHGKT